MKTRIFLFINIAILCLNQTFCGLLPVPAYTLFAMQQNEADNILENGDFTRGDLSPWWLFLNTVEGANSIAVVEDGWCLITNTTLSGEQIDWYIQLIQSFTSQQIEKLQSSKSYILTFDAFSESTNRPCYVYLGLDDEPRTALFYRQLF